MFVEDRKSAQQCSAKRSSSFCPQSTLRQRTRWLGWSAFLAIPLLLSGCGVPRAVVWSGDSSRLVFTTDGGHVAYYDLTNGTRGRQISLDAPTTTRIPAVHPKTGQILLVDVASGTWADTIRIRRNDVNGNEFVTRQVATWPAYNGVFKGTKPRPSGAIWSPGGKHALFWFESGRDRGLRFGRLDLDTDRMTEIVGTIPLVDLWHMGLNPIRDDDAGYLAVRRAEDRDGWSNLYFVSWDGWERSLRPTQELIDFEARTGKGRNRSAAPDRGFNAGQFGGAGRGTDGARLPESLQPGHLTLPFAPQRPFIPTTKSRRRGTSVRQQRGGPDRYQQPGGAFGLAGLPVPAARRNEIGPQLPLGTSGWKADGSIDVLVGQGRIRIDSRQSVTTFVDDEDLQRMRPDFVRERIIHWVPVGSGKFVIQLRIVELNNTVQSVIELAQPEQQRTKRLGYAAIGHVNFSPVILSPDKNKAAVTYVDRDGKVVTEVIDGDGMTLAKFQLAGPGRSDQFIEANREPTVASLKSSGTISSGND